MVNHIYTEEEVTELLWTLSDPIPFVLHCAIQHPVKGAIKFEPYLYQLDAIDHVHTNRLSVINSARQMGMTTTLGAYVLWQALFNPGQTIVICTSRLVGAVEWCDRIRYMIENLPPHLTPQMLRYNKTELAFDNGSRILFKAIAKDLGRGYAINMLVIDDAAYVNEGKMTDMWTSLYPCVATGTKVVIASCPKATGTFFHRIWTGNNGFAKMAIPWHAHPERDQAWYDQYASAMGQDRAKVEFCNLFEGDAEFLIG